MHRRSRRFLRRPVSGRIDRDGNEVEAIGDTLVAEVDRLRAAAVLATPEPDLSPAAAS